MEFSKLFIRIHVLYILNICLYSFGKGQIADEDESLTSGTGSDMIGGKCRDDLKHLFYNLEAPWALEMLDSAGKLPSGMLKGAFLIPGHYGECIGVHSPLDEEGHGGFHGKYCVSIWSLKANHSYYPLKIGLCVPDSCSGENVETVLRTSLRDIDNYKGIKTLKSYFTLNGVVCKNRDRPLDTPSMIYLCIVSIFITLTAVGSLLTILHYYKTIYAVRSKSLNGTKAEVYGELKAHNDEIPCCGTFDAKSSSDKRYSTQKPVSDLKKILLCFSAIDNSRKIFDVEKTEDQLLIIHGIKVLSIAWGILSHTYLYFILVAGNLAEDLKSMDKLIFELVFHTTYAVDSFFLLSGFLLTCKFLREAPKRKINWTVFYLHRFWRLTPPYLASTFFVMLVFKYIGSGPFWDDNHGDAWRTEWWKYVLYLQNFMSGTEMCAPWTWYLGNDVQFYVISPLFLYPLWKWPKTGFIILGSVLFASWSITGMITYTYDVFPLFTELAVSKDFDMLHRRYSLTLDMVYTKPYCRIGPYIIGIILGYIWTKTADKKVFLNWWQQVSGWFVALCCLFVPVFGLYHVELTMTVCLIHNVFARTIFAVGLAWLIYACATGHGGFVTKLLSFKLLIPLSRLSYCVYLVHCIIISGHYFSSPVPFFYTHTTGIVNFLGFFVMSYGLAFIFSLVFEAPFLNLEKLLLKKKQQ